MSGLSHVVTDSPSHFSVPVSVASRPLEVKAPTAFRTISEVATNLDVPQHVLRFWESKFQQIKPLKRGGGRRYYRPEDVTMIADIKDLLYTQGLTIKGAQKLLREGRRTTSARGASLGASKTEITEAGLSTTTATATSLRALEKTTANVGISTSTRRAMEGVLDELVAMRDLLRRTGI